MSSLNQRGTRRAFCHACNGTGKVLSNNPMNCHWITCPDCRGKGYIEYKLPPQQTRRF